MTATNSNRTAGGLRPWAVACAAALCALVVLGSAKSVHAQFVQPLDPEVKETEESKQKVKQLIAEILEPETTLKIDPRRSKLIRTTRPVSRFSVTNPEIVEIVQFSPTEFELIGGQAGQTTLTLWFGDPVAERTILRYLVRVGIDQKIEDRKREEYGDLQEKLNEFFPNSAIQLIPIADKLIIRGQARDAQEAAQILAMVSQQTTDQAGHQLVNGGGGLGQINVGTAVQPYPGVSDLPASNLINMLEVPGEMQVMLKVRVAELTRTALRSMGSDISWKAGSFALNSPFGSGGAFTAVYDNLPALKLALDYSTSVGYGKILAEPNLVTLSGKPASFNVGGSFAVPTVVGVEGVGAVSTSFQSFGTSVSFTPIVLDKDRFRLTVSPSISTPTAANTVNGVPGLESKSVNTTVDLREGQWLAIAGLIQDEQGGSKAFVPYIGSIPVLDVLFSKRNITRAETELLILVSPELVHPLEAEEVPLLLPGMEVTEPSDEGFFIKGLYEGDPRCEHRSTIWPIYQQRMYEARNTAVREAKKQTRYQHSENYYVNGCHGFSN